MTSYIIRRLLLLPLILGGLTLLIFGMTSLLPCGVLLSLYVQDVPKNQGDLNQLCDKYGLNDPMVEQYGRWVVNLSQGNLGFSNTHKQPVTEVIFDHLPATVELALWAIVPIVLLGVQLGIFTALRHNRPADHVARILTILGTSTPSFMGGLLLLMLFAAYLGWMPTGGRLTHEMQRVVDAPAWTSVTGMYTVDSLLNARLDVFRDAIWHLILPVITLAYINVAVLVRITRSSMLETMRQDYITTARAKGLFERQVIQRHARPNAMLPVVTVCGFLLIGLLGGAAITETVYTWPGIGKRFVEAATTADVITVLGFALFNGVVLIFGNLCIDVLYAWLDPRVRLN